MPPFAGWALTYLAVGLVYACLGPSRMPELGRCYQRFGEGGLPARVALALFLVAFWPAILFALLSYRLIWLRRWMDAAKLRASFPARMAALRYAARDVAQAFDRMETAGTEESPERAALQGALTAARITLAERSCELLDRRCPGCEGKIFGILREDRVGAVCSSCSLFMPVDELVAIAESSLNEKPSKEDVFA